MSDKASEVPAYDAVPCGALAAVELIHVNRCSSSSGKESSDLLLDVLGNVLWSECQQASNQLCQRMLGMLPTYLLDGVLVHCLLCCTLSVSL
jgi:hypothetical protein